MEGPTRQALGHRLQAALLLGALGAALRVGNTRMMGPGVRNSRMGQGMARLHARWLLTNAVREPLHFIATQPFSA